MIQLDYRAETQAMIKPEERTQNKVERSTSTTTASITSRVCHWLTPILYLLGRRLVLPLYFRRL
ncbi:MAG TPA: 1-acyl-sn-glycerol-3-phosphate acyltransferase, partial [Coleofasciculaceae cyanobacterium]